MEISHALMDFVADGFKFEREVVRVKAKHAAGYDATEVHTILEKKNELENGVSLVKRTKSCVLNKYQDNQTNFEKEVKRAAESSRRDQDSHTLLAIEPNYNSLIDGTESALVKFKPKVHFAKSLGDLAENMDEEEVETQGDSVFLTEASSDMPPSVSPPLNKSVAHKAGPVLNENALELAKVDTKLNWDDHLIGQLSENTARWIAMKSTSDGECRTRRIERMCGLLNTTEPNLSPSLCLLLIAAVCFSQAEEEAHRAGRGHARQVHAPRS